MQRDALNAEKIVWQLRFMLIKLKCPVSRRAFSSFKDRDNSGL
jgi:hypothetical protein